MPDSPHTAATPAPSASLEGIHSSVAVPDAKGSFWQNLKAFTGPAILVSVGYMDPGNWATDLEAGARYRYGLLWVVFLASLMAVVLQILAARLGVVTGKDLAQACRDYTPHWTRWPNWLAAEVAIGACDLAEVLGSAVAIRLLTGIPLFWAVLITAADVLLLLALQGIGMRKIEAILFVLVATIGGCYFVEIFILPAVRPDLLEIGRYTFTPTLAKTGMAALAVGIIGATVMPHNLYLHSALVQTRKFQKDQPSVRRALMFNTLDSIGALTVAYLVNAAILVMAAITFHQYLNSPQGLPDGHGHFIKITEDTDWIQVAYTTLTPLMGAGIASTLFAIALLASGQSSTVTGTLAGQVVMEGFMHWRVRPWVRRLITRTLAILPAVILIGIKGDSSANSLLVVSQIVLGLQLPFAMVPLLYFNSSRKIMGHYRTPPLLLAAGWTACVVIVALDLWAVATLVAGAFH